MKRIVTLCFFAAMLVTAVRPSHAQMAPNDSLYKAFGEKAGIAALIDDFVARLVADPRTKPAFEHADLDNLRSKLVDQLCELSGGPCKYTGKDMKTAHAGMDVQKSDFNALVEVLQQSMDMKHIPFTSQNKMLALLAPMNRDIIK
jgi:hemoglobin